MCVYIEGECVCVYIEGECVCVYIDGECVCVYIEGESVCVYIGAHAYAYVYTHIRTHILRDQGIGRDILPGDAAAEVPAGWPAEGFEKFLDL